MTGRLLNISLNDPRSKEPFILTQLRALRALGWDVTGAFEGSQTRPGPTEDDLVFRSVVSGAQAVPRSIPERIRKATLTLARRNSEQAGPDELAAWALAIKDNRADFVLVQFGSMAARLLPVLIASGRPWIVQFHGYDLTERCRHWGYRLALATVMRSASAAFVCSAFLAAELRRHIRPSDAQKVHVVTPGYDETVFAASRRSVRSSGPLRAISVARLVEVKGHDLAIEAVARAGNDMRLTIVGEGEERDRLERLIADLGVADRVSLRGALPPRDVAAALAGSDVFIQLSRRARTAAIEGLGLSPIEAAATGLPVIVSNSGGLGETCRDGETGEVVLEGDVQAAARSLVSFDRDRGRAVAMGAAGACWARSFASRVQAKRADEVLGAL